MSRPRPRIAAIYPYDPSSPSRIRSNDTLRVLTNLGDVTVFAPDLGAKAVRDLAAMGCKVVARRDTRLSRMARLVRALVTRRSISFAYYRPVVPSKDELLANFDFVFSERCMLPKYASSLPVVVDLVDNFQHQVEQLARTAAMPRRLGYLYDSRVISRDILALSEVAHLIICTTQHECDGLRHVGVPASKLLPYLHVSQVNGLLEGNEGVAGFRPPAPSLKERVAVFHGRQSYPANQAAVDRLLAVASQQCDWRFLVFGEGWTPNSKKNLEFRGFQPDLSLLLQCSLGVYPVEVAVGVQNKVLEALAAGLPVLVTPQVHSGLPDAVKSALGDRILVREVSDFPDAMTGARDLHRSEDAAHTFRRAYDTVIQTARSNLSHAMMQLAPSLAASGAQLGRHEH